MIKSISPIKRILDFGVQISILTYFLATIILVVAFFIAYSFDIELYIFLALLTLPLLWLMIHYPRIWIYCIVLTFTVFFINDDSSITATRS